MLFEKVTSQLPHESFRVVLSKTSTGSASDIDNKEIL